MHMRNVFIPLTNLEPVARKPINANAGLDNTRGLNFLHPNHLHSHNLWMDEKNTLIYNPKAKVMLKEKKSGK